MDTQDTAQKAACMAAMNAQDTAQKAAYMAAMDAQVTAQKLVLAAHQAALEAQLKMAQAESEICRQEQEKKYRPTANGSLHCKEHECTKEDCVKKRSKTAESKLCKDHECTKEDGERGNPPRPGLWPRYGGSGGSGNSRHSSERTGYAVCSCELLLVLIRPKRNWGGGGCKTSIRKKRLDAWTPRAHGAREGRVRGFLGGALRCLADSEAPPKKRKEKRLVLYLFLAPRSFRCVMRSSGGCFLHCDFILVKSAGE
jgi:hypothetical protein